MAAGLLAGGIPALAQSPNTQITGFASVPWGSDSAAIHARYGPPTETRLLGDTIRLVYADHRLLSRPVQMGFLLTDEGLVEGDYQLATEGEYCYASFDEVTAAIQRANAEIRAEPASRTSMTMQTFREDPDVQCGYWLALGGTLVGSKTFRDPTGTSMVKVLWIGRDGRRATLTVRYLASDPEDEEVRRAF